MFYSGESEKEIFDDLKEYYKRHGGKSVYYYIHLVRPSKENYRLEYMMEIELISSKEFCAMPLWLKA